MRVLIVGCGYVGLPLGADLARQGHEVFGLRRRSGAEPLLQDAGIHPVVGDITCPEDLARLTGTFDWVVSCVASGGGTAADYRRVYLDGTRNLLNRLAPVPPKKFIYTSSTSVYGQNDASEVTELSPTMPSSDTAQVLVETEQLLLDAFQRRNFPAVILRLAGIYGPGRGHWFKQFLAREAQIEGTGDRILNMIHRDDAAGCVAAALERGMPGEIYNAVDSEPVSQLDFFKWLAGTLGEGLPPMAPGSPDSRKRGGTNKRVSNQKLKVQLNYQFKYPDFRTGYRAELQRLGR